MSANAFTALELQTSAQASCKKYWLPLLFIATQAGARDIQ
jgi:hypothetical protein